MSDQNTDRYELIEKRYKETIDFYKNSSKKNKNWYRRTTLISIILSAFITLLSALSSAKELKDILPALLLVLTVPIVSFILTVIAGLTQIFHWGPAWRDMTIAYLQLQAAYDKFKTIEPADIDYVKETETINQFVISESKDFFARMLEGITSDKDKPE